MRLGVLTVLVLTLLGVQGIRVKRDNCRRVTRRYNGCARRSFAEYQAALRPGEDGRPDFVARKTCNYITTSIEECPKELITGGCKTNEEVATMTDALMGQTLQQVKETVESWDSSKCPAVRSYMVRLGLVPPEEVEGGDCGCWMESINTQIDRFNRAWTAFMGVWGALV